MRESKMFSNRDIKRVREELLRDASYAETYEDYEDPPMAPPIPKRTVSTRGSPLRPRSPDGVSMLQRLDTPPFREDLSIVCNWRADAERPDPDALNWTTQADHADIVRSYYEAQAKNPDVVLPVPITRQNGVLGPCTAPYPVGQQAQADQHIPEAQQVPMTSRWSDDSTM
jgi:hypothetical protein